MKLFTRKEDAPETVPVKDFNEVSQLGHFAGGLGVVFGSTLLFGGHKAMWIGFALVVVLIGIKEAFIDPRTESPIVAGSGVEDWFFWVVGAALAVILINFSALWLKT